MYNMFLDQWFGRFGNNLKQLSNALYVAEKTKSTLRFKEHPIVANRVFDFSTGEQSLVDYPSTFWKDQVFGILATEEEVEENRSYILKKYVLPLLPYTPQELGYDIVVHFRGGDIWNRPSHTSYVQCPLSYYEKIFKREMPTRILLVCEDNRNPMIEVLLKHPDWDCEYQSSTIERDINTLLNARVLVKGGISTFSDTLALSSPHLRTLYTPAFEYTSNLQPYERLVKDYYIMEADVVEAKIVDFIKIGEWDAAPEQIRLMFDHSHKSVALRKV